MRIDKEMQEFRDLMTVPDEYQSGFGWGTVLMALFVGLVMAPAQLYMGLVAGMGFGDAPNWVTTILYVEVSRRAFKKLRSPEIFVLFYMCGAMMSTGTQGLLWNQFFVQSETVRKMGLTEYIPSWFAPSDPNVLAERNFFNPAWWKPLGLMLLGSFVGRIDKFGLGYVLFRLTSDTERLPFPMAPVGAMGVTALADASSQRETWRWRTFSIGAMGGIAFGFIYMAIPNITGAIFSQPISIIPIPFVDLTRYIEAFLPAVPLIISFSLGSFITGLVVPFWGVVGALIAAVITVIANPVLYYSGILKSWTRGIGGLQTMMSNTMDFYLSLGIGVTFAFAIVGFWQLAVSFKKKRAELGEMDTVQVDWRRFFNPPAGRGDISIWVSLGIYLCSTTLWIGLGYWLINYGSGPLHGAKFPLWILIFYGFVYTPVISYVSTRMIGIIGIGISIPYVKEASFILSGYKGAAIWFAPIPMNDYAGQATFFRETELTGTKFSSIIKAEILIFPIVFIGTLVFSQFIWSMGPLPGQMFPYTQKFWEFSAFQSSLIYTSILPNEGVSPFFDALRLDYVLVGFTLSLGIFITLNWLNLPMFFIYGIIGGMMSGSGLNDAIIFMMLGALFGKYVCRPWFGDKWPQYRIVFAAGFGAGIGLISMLSMGIALMFKSVIKLPV